MKINIKNYKKIKDNKFFFGLNNDIAKVYLKKTYTNIFLTLADINNKVVLCRTPATSEKLWNKRTIVNVYAMEKIIYDIKFLLNLFNIKFLHIVFKVKLKSHAYFLLEKLKSYGFIIQSIKSLKTIPHNGVRGRKVRRI